MQCPLCVQSFSYIYIYIIFSAFFKATLSVLSIPRKLTCGSLDGALCPMLSPAALTSLPLHIHSSTINPTPCPHMFPRADYLTCGWTKRSDRSWKPRWCICPSCRRTRPCFWTQTSTGESSRIFTSKGVPPVETSSSLRTIHRWMPSTYLVVVHIELLHVLPADGTNFR